MNKTIKMYSYYLKYDCDKDAIGFEAQANGCELLTGKGQVVITMWETNPYNSLFALKYDKDFLRVKAEDWIL
jgi:hypothetical protein